MPVAGFPCFLFELCTFCDEWDLISAMRSTALGDLSPSYSMWTIPNPTEEPVISQDLPKGRPGSLIPGCYENTNHLGSIDIFTESDLQSSRRQLLSGRN